MPKSTAKTLETYAKIVSAYDPSVNESSPLITKYELNQLLSLRMLHISRGSPIFLTEKELEDLGFDESKVRVYSNIELRRIVVEELLTGKCPFIVRRNLPNGKVEHWKVSDMDFSNVRYILEGTFN